MSLTYRKRIRIAPGVHLNLSRSGVSVSAKVGPLTVNSRGRRTVRLGHGLSWRTGR